MNTMPKTAKYALMAALLATLLLGCGYSMRKGPPVTSVRLGPIENRTYEPRLQDILYDALSLEFMRQGIRIDPRSEYCIKGSIDRLRLRGTAERGGVTVQYEVTIIGDFFLVGPDGSERPLRKGNAFTVSFGDDGVLELLMAGRELAVQRAMADMAREIAASIIYGR